MDNLVGTDRNDSFLANAQTLGLGDVLAGGPGQDSLVLSISGTGANFVDGFDTVSVETIRVKSLSSGASNLDLSGTKGVTKLESFEVEGASLTFTDIQSVNGTELSIVDTDEDHTYAYDLNAYAPNAVATVALNLQEVRDEDETENENGVDIKLLNRNGSTSNVETINLTSAARAEAGPTAATENYLQSLQVGDDFETLNISGNADLEIENRLDKNVNRVNAGSLAADLTLDLHAQGVKTNANGTVNAATTIKLVVTGAIGDDNIDIGGELRTAGITQVNLGDGNDNLVLGDESVGMLGHATITGDAGNDTILVNQTGLLDVNLGAGNDTLTINGDVDDLTTLAADGESKVVAGTGNDTVNIQGDGDYNIQMNDGDDMLVRNGDGDATVDLGAGDDDMFIGSEAEGFTGNYNITAGTGNDEIEVWAAGNHVANLGAGNDSIAIVGDGDSTVTADSGNDIVTIVGDGNQTVSAGDGNDAVTIIGVGEQNVSLGIGNDTLLINGSASENFDNASSSGTTSITGGDGDDSVDVRFDHILDADLGAGADSLTLRAKDLTTDDTIVGGAGVDTLVLTNEDGLYEHTDRSDTRGTTGFEIYDLRDHNQKLDITNQMVATATGNNITVSTQKSTVTALATLTLTTAATTAGATAVPLLQGMTVAAFNTLVLQWRNGQIEEAVEAGQDKEYYDELSFEGTLAEVEALIRAEAAADLEAYLSIQGVTLARTDTNGDGDTSDNADQVFFILNDTSLTQTVDLTGLTSNLPNAFTLLGGNLTDIVIASDELINGRMTLNFDSTKSNALSDQDTLRVVDGANITAADLRNVTGLERIELVSKSNQAQQWTIDLTDNVVNQTTANADLIIHAAEEVAEGSIIRIKLDTVSLVNATSNVIVERNGNVEDVIIVIDGVERTVTAPEYGDEIVAFNSAYGLYVVTTQSFTTNTDDLRGTYFVADSVDQMQNSDQAVGVGGEDVLQLNFAVSNADESLEEQFNDAGLVDIEIVQFVTNQNVRMDGLGGDYNDDIEEVRTGSGDDLINNADPYVTWSMGAGDDEVYLADIDYANFTVLGGEGHDRVYGAAFVDQALFVSGVEYIDMDYSLVGDVGDDMVFLLEANEELVTIERAEVIFGSDGDDNVFFDNDGGYVAIFGEDGDDTLTGSNATPDYVYAAGGEGKDTIDVSANYEAQVYGDNTGDPDYADDDTITVRAGRDAYVDGGAGADVIDVEVSDAVSVAGEDSEVFGDAGDDDITAKFYGDDLFSDVDFLVDGGSGDDVIDALARGADDFVVLGGAGNDTIDVDADDVDYLYVDGGAGDDVMTVDIDYIQYDATVDGGTGNDTITVTVTGEVEDDIYVDGGDGDDTISVDGDGSDYADIIGGLGADDITVIDIDNAEITGGAGNDSIDVALNLNGIDTLYFGNIDYAANQTTKSVDTQGLDTITGFNFEDDAASDPAVTAVDELDFDAFLIGDTDEDTLSVEDIIWGDWSQGMQGILADGSDDSIVVIAGAEGQKLKASDIAVGGYTPEKTVISFAPEVDYDPDDDGIDDVGFVALDYSFDLLALHNPVGGDVRGEDFYDIDADGFAGIDGFEGDGDFVEFWLGEYAGSSADLDGHVVTIYSQTHKDYYGNAYLESQWSFDVTGVYGVDAPEIVRTSAIGADKLYLADNARSVVIMSTGGSVDAQESFDVYFVQDVDSSNGSQNWKVDHVATIESISLVGVQAVYATLMDYYGGVID